MEQNTSNSTETKSIPYLNNKRKFVAEFLGMPYPKHLCGNQIHIGDPLFKSRANPKQFKVDIFAKQAESDAPSSKDSNSFHGNADSAIFTFSASSTATTTYPRIASFDETSMSSISWGAPNSDIQIDSPEIESSTKPISTTMESFSTYEDDLLEFSSQDDYNCCEQGSNANADKELYDLLHLNGIAPSDYILSSERWSINQGTDAPELGAKKLTIDKEFEQYFSMLML